MRGGEVKRMRSRGRSTKPLCSSSMTQLLHRARILFSMPVFREVEDMTGRTRRNGRTESTTAEKRR